MVAPAGTVPVADPGDGAPVEQPAANGDPLGFAVLISRHYEAAYRQACRLVADPIEAQDLVQEAFLKAHVQLRKLSDPACFGVWLRRIVYSTCMDWHRQPRYQLYRSSQGSASSFPLVDLSGPESRTPLDLLLQSELADQLREAVAGLAPRYRRAVLLYHFDQLRCEEVAAELGVPLNTALSLLHRARGRLRHAVNDYVQETPECTTVALDFGSLPSRQGWRYHTGYEFLPGGPPEGRVCHVRDGVLTIDDADLYPDSQAYYSLAGVVDPYRPFVLRLRARKERETARYPEYQVGDNPRRPRNRSFGVRVYTGREAYHLEISACQLRLNRRLMGSGADNRQFHEYCLEGTPGVGCRLLVDGAEVGTALPESLDQQNHVGFGDMSAASGNCRAQITHFSFTQVRPGVQAPWRPDGEGLADLLTLRPFAALGAVRVGSPVHPRWYKEQSAQRLAEVVHRCSRRWRLGPAGTIVPLDLASA